MNEEFAILGLRLIGHVFVPGHFLLFWALTFMEKLYTKSSDLNFHQPDLFAVNIDNGRVCVLLYSNYNPALFMGLPKCQ
ncbi:hypothetical protein QR98_0076580 [Sarcoptes scabiei]|uniref:Uncharacterized protein n=1 Tax=Sarcoptes scabiei TaxID=52283 RepID=A0A132ADX3_SARSC|nr:hypothetical protein QR98_0076580 [Sarcoptes scabiei]